MSEASAMILEFQASLYTAAPSRQVAEEWTRALARVVDAVRGECIREEATGAKEDAHDRISELEDLVCEAAPLSWATYGFPDGTELAHAWEKRAKALLDRYPDAMKRMGWVRGPIAKTSKTGGTAK